MSDTAPVRKVTPAIGYFGGFVVTVLGAMFVGEFPVFSAISIPVGLIILGFTLFDDIRYRRLNRRFESSK